MRNYEAMVIVDARLEEGDIQKAVDRFSQAVGEAGGEVVNVDRWGKRRFAYEIDHQHEGYYHLVNFDAEPATLDEVSRILKIMDGVMRHMAVRRIDGGRPRAAGAVQRPQYAANTRSQEEE